MNYHQSPGLLFGVQRVCGFQWLEEKEESFEVLIYLN